MTSKGPAEAARRAGADETRPGGVRPPAARPRRGVDALASTRADGVPAGSRAAPHDDGGLEPGDMVADYRVQRVLGQGGMGRVYLARDVRLGRKVALKVVRPEVMAPSQVARLLDEARITARFSHPHIVGVYAAGEHKGQPYLALEYLDGETLAERLADRRPGVAEALRYGLAIARALAEAHAHGVLHRDLKPHNVFIPRDGRLRVVDFGLAKASAAPEEPDDSGAPGLDRPFATQAGALVGTPAYMAPEQWDGREVGAAADVWALGILVVEMLTGRRPWDVPGADLDDLRRWVTSPDPVPWPDLPEPVPDGALTLARRCLAKDPAARPSAAEVVRVLEALLGGRDRPLDPEANPFRGLRAFDERHAGRFFGRDAEIDAFVERLRDHPLLPVVGASGVGKSSLVRAGVVPRLREAGPWVVLTLQPGRRPLRALASRVVAATHGRDPLASDLSAAPEPDRGAEIEQLAEALRASPALLGLRLSELASARGARVLLVVDQLEEVFTLTDDEATRRTFLTALARAADDVADPTRVTFTLRHDFLGLLADTPEMRAALGPVTVLREPDARALRELLRRPVEQAGYRWEDDALVDALVGEVAGESASLPLLQFVCHAMWEARDRARRVLRWSDYEALGGVAGALARHADQVVQGLSVREAAVARAVMLRLVTGQGTRRLVPRDALEQALGPDAAHVVARLVEARLVSVRRGSQAEDDDGAVLELTHESLVTHWERLRGWMAASQDDLRLAGALEQAASVWDARGRSAELLWRGAELEQARVWLGATAMAVAPVAREFVEAGAARERVQRGRRRAAAAAGALVLVAVAVVSLLVAREFAAREQKALDDAREIDLAAADVGRFDLVLAPFDWDAAAGVARPVPPSALPGLSWTLHGRRPDAPREPGGPVMPVRVEVAADPPGGQERVTRVEVQGGPKFLSVTGRGRPGETCAPSWVPLQWLPGYATRQAEPVPRVVVPVPTCAASRAGTALVPAGPFVKGGAGEPPTRRSEFVDDEEVVALPAYRIDRTEVTNAAWTVFASMADTTGRARPAYPGRGVLEDAGLPDRPVTNVDWGEARDFCRFLGKDLPTTEQWEKAARGGLSLDAGGARPNPAPRRNVPWGGGADLAGNGPPRANLVGAGDGWRGPAPVGSFPAGASPYGVLDLAGNAAEWTRTPGGGRLRIVRGGDWDDDPAEELHVIAFENQRDERYVDFATGLRCVEEAVPAPSAAGGALGG